MTTTTRVALVRRMLLAGITALIALLAVSATSPTTAHAIGAQQPDADFAGWARTATFPAVCRAATGFDIPCTAQTQAWRWTGRTWTAAYIVQGMDVYVHPYVAPWHWIWTPSTGWLAIHGSRLQLRLACTGMICPAAA